MQAPAGPVPRNLVEQVERAMEKLEGWKEEGWLKKVVERV